MDMTAKNTFKIKNKNNKKKYKKHHPLLSHRQTNYKGLSTNNGLIFNLIG